MRGNEFVKRIRALGKRRGVKVRFEARKGKGSHGTLHFGDRFTTVKDRRKEISRSLLAEMLQQLGITKEAFRNREEKHGDPVSAVGVSRQASEE